MTAPDCEAEDEGRQGEDGRGRVQQEGAEKSRERLKKAGRDRVREGDAMRQGEAG